MGEAAATTSNFEHKCYECGKVYSTTTSLYRHIRRVHAAGQTVSFKPYPLLKCPLCDEGCISRQKMEQHFVSDHEIELHKESWEFTSQMEFKTWKSAMEDENNTLFVKKNGSKMLKGVKTTYYFCYRSGHFNSEGAGLRRLKKGGSIRMGAFCPSMMKVMEKEAAILVDYIATHLGHTYSDEDEECS